MTTDQMPDPRPLYDRSLTWVLSLLTDLDPDRLGAPTPCTDFDVRALAGHLVATVDRARVIGEGGEVFSLPHVVTGIADDRWAEAYSAAVQKMWEVWRDPETGDALLDRSLSAPWGLVPGRTALWGYLNETLVHGWDLAVATGQDEEADPEVAGAVLAVVEQIIPALPRGGQVPFAPPAPPRPEAGPTERLANWSGHARG